MKSVKGRTKGKGISSNQRFFYAAVRDTDHSLTINKKDVND